MLSLLMMVFLIWRESFRLGVAAERTIPRGPGLGTDSLPHRLAMELMTDQDFYSPISAWHRMPKLIGAHRPLPWICVDDLGAIATCAFTDSDQFLGANLKLAADTRSIAD